MGPRQRKVLRDLWRSRLLFSTVVLLLAVGVGMFITIYSAFQNLDASESAMYEELRFADVFFKLQSAPAAAADLAHRVPGVIAVEGRSVQDLPIERPDGSSATATARLISLPEIGRPTVDDIVVKQGQYPADGVGSGVLVDEQFASFYGLRPGDSVGLVVDGGVQSLPVDGTFVSPEYVWKAKSPQEPFVGKGEFAVVMARQGLVGQLLHTQRQINEILVRFDPAANQETTTMALTQVLSPFGIRQVTPRQDQISYALLKLDLDGFRQIGVAAPALFLIITVLVIYVLLSRIVQGQRAVIGMIRAVGFSRGQVLRHYLAFALFVGVAGSLLGVVLGLLLGSYVTRLYVQTIGIPVLRIEPHLPVLGIAAAIALLVCVTAGLWPAFTASRLPPSEAMRPSPLSSRRSAVVEWLLGISKPPYTIRLALRNIARVPGRTASSVLGIAMAVALVLAAFGMLDSMNYGLKVQFDETRQYDLKATFVRPVPEDTLVDYASWEQVSDVEPILEIPVTLTHGSLSQNALLAALPEGGKLFHLRQASGSQPLSTNGLFLSDGLAAQLGVGIGETATLYYGTGTTVLPVVGTVAQPLSSGAYIRLSEASALVGPDEPVVTGVLLKLHRPGDEPQVRALLHAQPEVLAVEAPREARQSFQQLMALFYEFVGIFVLFGIALGAIAVFNTVMINVVERRQEMATMRTLGFRRRSVDNLVTVEDLLAGIIGILLGLGLGYLLEIELLSLFESGLFDLPIYIAPVTYATVAIASLLVVLVSQSPGLRALHRLDLATIMKERAS